ncbi:hypothetical protein [Flavobacterium sp. ACN6]|uniref:hypothetical protein n=1 Tax=Flavobacterium sp. ACN6 TaxID=1920426 RepID=UPI000BB3877F|nr:hypothetical protein [Flavobacterium sp. ACN6]PBJ14602.1 hypothetical protein BSF42_10240 [Flavobacterium sp. ACN6]
MGNIYLYVNLEEKRKGDYNYPIVALNYATLDDLKDQLSEDKYTFNVKNYLRYGQGDKYISAQNTKQKIKIGGIIAILIVVSTVIGMGYYIVQDKKKNKISNREIK